MSGVWRKRVMGYALSVLSVAAATLLLVAVRDHVNQITVALALLLIVLFSATWAGSRPAIAASVVAMLCFNFFFLPPTGTLTIADPQNWIALAAFLVTSLMVGGLSAAAKRRAEEAERGGVEIKRLYEQLQIAFERASHAEALRQSEQLKSALLDAVTHDLRTPLTSIKASATMLIADEKATEKGGERAAQLDAEGRREMLEVIEEEANRLDRFVESLVDIARIEAGEMQLRRSWDAIEEIVGAALARAANLLREHRIEVHIEPELPIVRVDARAVAEVVYTLLDNAAKYSPKGARILVTAERAEDEMIEIGVEDEGAGIEPEMREKVFDKFFRATDGAAAAGRSGLGMGLAIARGIVEAHGGRISIEDGREGFTTRVRFTVPVGDEEPAMDAREDGVHQPEVKAAPGTPAVEI